MTDNHDPNNDNDLSWLNDSNGQDSDFNAAFGQDQSDWELPPLDIGTPLGSAPSESDDFSSLFGDLSNASDDVVPNDPAIMTDEIPSWLQASAPSGATQDLPVIDDLIPLGQPATSDTEGIPSWLDTQEMAAAPIANKEDVPPWLAEADETSERAIAEAEAIAKKEPVVAPGDQSSYLPPWLQDADDFGAAEANAFEASFDDLDFAVDQQEVMNDPFGGIGADSPAASEVFGGDMPDWMRTREQSSVGQDELSSFFSDVPSIPGESTDPLLLDLLQSSGGSSADIDLLSLLEQTDKGASIQTGMLAPFEERHAPPPTGITDNLPDFDALMAQPPAAQPEFHPMLDDLAPAAQDDFDFSKLMAESQAPQDEPSDFGIPSFAAPMPSLVDDAELPTFDDLAPAAQDDFDFSTLMGDAPAPQDAPNFGIPSFAAPEVSLPGDFDLPTFDDLPSQPAETGLPSFVAPPVPPSRPKPPAKPSRPADDDFDAFLTALQGDELAIDARVGDSDPLDLNSLLSDPKFGDLPDTTQSTSEVKAVVPDFLRDVSVREASVAAVLRQQQDIPLEDLPEELRALHSELAAIPQATAPSEILLPIATPIVPQQRTAIGLSDSQRRGAELLRSLAGLTGVAVDEADAAVQATQKRTQRRRLGINATRLLVAASLILAVILPFVSDIDALKVGVQPPAVFAPTSSGGQAYNLIESLAPGSMVLISADYSPGSIGEIDALTIPVLRHIFVKGLKPVVIGSDPVTLQHVGRLADEAAQGGVRNVDYVIGRYLIGESVGTQDFVQNISALLETDLNGQPTGLNVSDFTAFSGVIVLTDRADSVRVWAEQVLPRVTIPIIFGVGSGAAPLSAPYTSHGGFWVGLRDGMTYSRQLNEQYPLDTFILPMHQAPTPTPTLVPLTPIPTSVATEVPTLESTIETPVGLTATLEVTSEPTATLEATVVITETPAATQETVVAPSVTPTVEPTATTEGITATPEPTIVTETFVVITGTERLNVRQGPGTSFQIVTSVLPGERFLVLSQSDDGAWIEIQLPDQRTGWVSASRTQIDQGESALPAMRVGAGGLAQSAAIQTSAERRWSAVTLGAVVAAILMALGSFIGIIQIILRRRR